MCHTSSIDGKTRPSILLHKGNTSHRHCTDKWYMDSGASAGSTISTMPTVFTTEEAREKATSHVVKGPWNVGSNCDGKSTVVDVRGVQRFWP
jgi:hypothetical protein